MHASRLHCRQRTRQKQDHPVREEQGAKKKIESHGILPRDAFAVPVVVKTSEFIGKECNFNACCHPKSGKAYVKLLAFEKVIIFIFEEFWAGPGCITNDMNINDRKTTIKTNILHHVAAVKSKTPTEKVKIVDFAKDKTTTKHPLVINRNEHALSMIRLTSCLLYKSESVSFPDRILGMLSSALGEGTFSPWTPDNGVKAFFDLNQEISCDEIQAMCEQLSVNSPTFLFNTVLVINNFNMVLVINYYNALIQRLLSTTHMEYCAPSLLGKAYCHMAVCHSSWKPVT